MNIEYFRKRAGMTQQELASRVNVTQGCISNWEAGNWAPLKKYFAPLAAALGCSIDDLTRDLSAGE